MDLQLFETKIRRDKEGRYCLNDLHKAAGGEERHGPKFFMATQQAKELADELSDGGNPPSVSIKGGKNQGTYVCKELVYAYAMWISAKFHLYVIQTFDQFIQSEQTRMFERNEARLEFPDMTLALLEHRTSLGKQTSFFHYSNEADMINIIALGMTARQFREEHKLDDSEQLRDYQTPFQIFSVEQLQRMDEQLINLGFTVEQRRNALQTRFEELSIRLLNCLETF